MFDAVILAGGRGARLGGVDKPSILLGDSSLLERVVAAVAAARAVVVVGPRRPLAREVTWCLERPAGGGPVAAIAAGLAHTQGEFVVVLAADLPWIAPAVRRLLTALSDRPNADVAVVVDSTGRRNHLAAAWRRAALNTALNRLASTRAAAAQGSALHGAAAQGAAAQGAALHGAAAQGAAAQAAAAQGSALHGAAARCLFEQASVVEVADPAGDAADCDTWDDLERARVRAEPREKP
jgi:molybdopterin-guanine dinucleotide biosynthesis protein A